MSTELQQQVQRHREKHIISTSISQGRPSLFLAPKDAAKVDVADIYETAIKGLKALSQYDSRFAKFHRTLFMESSINLQRELKTSSVTEQTHNAILRMKIYIF